MTRSRRLRALLPILVATAACEGTSTDPAPSGQTPGPGETAGDPALNTPVSRDGFDRALTCAKGAALWSAATPRSPVDGLEVRSKTFDEPYAVAATPLPLCTKAADTTACNGAAASIAGDGWDPFSWDRGLPRGVTELAVTTTGDAIGVLRTLDELSAALAPIDSPNEALLLAHLRSGWFPSCAADPSVLAARADGDGWELLVRRGGQCGESLVEANVRVASDGIVTVRAMEVLEPGGPNSCGRRPDGLEPQASPSAPGLGGLLAQMAWLEAASVPAFSALARDLERHGAPEALVARARAARSDEIVHARLTREAARRHGAAVERPRVPRARPRSLFELAVENAVEGCVREAFGALLASHQAEHARDPELRAMFSRIAVDETEHAALSLDLADWIEPRLSGAERDALAGERARAFAELELSLAREPSREEVELGGMPRRATSRRLLAALRSLDA